MILRCTGKLLSVLRVKPQPVVSGADGEDWYANLLWVDGRKCLLVTHSATLFSVFAPDVRVADLRPIGAPVVALVGDALASEGLAGDTFGVLEPGAVTVAKTVDRRVLGTMNDLAFQCELAAVEAGGLGRVDVAAVNHWLRRTINSMTGYVPPIELAAGRDARK